MALLLDDTMGASAAIQVYDGRWMHDGERVVWRGADEGNERRQQVVTSPATADTARTPSVLFAMNGNVS